MGRAGALRRCSRVWRISPGGRPSQPVDSEKQSLEQQFAQARRENAILQHKMALKDVLIDLKLTPGTDRAGKK